MTGGCVLVQADSGRPLPAEAQVRARVSPYGICDGQSATETDFYSTSSVFLCQYDSTMLLHTHISYRG
jgi:hypothetical protein